MNDRHRGYTEKELDDLLEKRDRSLVRGYEMKLADKDADLARLREENAKLLEEVNLKNQWEHDRINELARLSALVEEVREIVEDYYKYAGNNYQICGLNFTANDWLRRARGGN